MVQSSRPVEALAIHTAALAHDLLHGGFEYGAVSCVSGSQEKDDFEIYLNAMCSHMLSSSTAYVGIIDTTGSFEVLELFRVLQNRARSAGGHPTQDQDVEDALNRVKVMRVFDMMGFVESLNEIQSDLEQGDNVDMIAPRPAPKLTMRRMEIADSEDEDSEDDINPVSLQMLHDEQDIHMASAVPPSTFKSNKSQSWLIVVGHLHHLSHQTTRNSYVQGQALIATVMRSLRHLTIAHDICTIVMNAVEIQRVVQASSRDVRNHGSTSNMLSVSQSIPAQTRATAPSESGGASCITSIRGRPALGRIFEEATDLHLMISAPPQSWGIHGLHRREPLLSKASNLERVAIVEALRDRHGSRRGKWTVIRTENNVMP